MYSDLVNPTGTAFIKALEVLDNNSSPRPPLFSLPLVTLSLAFRTGGLTTMLSPRSFVDANLKRLSTSENMKASRALVYSVSGTGLKP